MKDNHEKTLKLVQLAFLTALVVVVQLFFSAVQIVPGITLNFVLVPIVIGAVFIGPLAGCFIGAVAGIVIAVQTFMLASSIPLYRIFTEASPILTALLCIVKTAVAGLAAGYLYRLLNRVSAKKSLNVLVPAAVCPILNTGIFCLGVILIYAKPLAESAEFGAAVAGGQLVSFAFIGLAGVNFIVELVLNVILCPVIAKALFSTKLFKNS